MKARNVLATLGSFLLILGLGAIPFSMSLTTSPAFAAEDKTLEIGVLAALTGFGSAAETLIAQGAEVAQDWVNEKGGITVDNQKYMVKLVVEDTKSTATGTVAAATKLVFDDKVKFILGTVVPYMVEAGGTVTEPAEVLRVLAYNCAMPSEYGPKTPYTFLGQDASVEGAIASLTYLVESHPEVKSVVFIIPDDGSIPYLGKVVKQLAEERGLTVKGEVIGWTHDTVDFTPIAAKATARDPDAIHMTNGWPGPLGSILKAAREAGYTKPIVSFHNPAPDVKMVAGEAASTNFITNGIIYDDPGNPPMIKELGDRFVKKYGNAFYYHYWGFNLLYHLAQAIEAADSIDPKVVKTKWETMDTIDTVYGPGRMCGEKTYGFKHTVCHPVAIQVLDEGKVTQVKWVDVVTP
ncbi:MAG: ABC transporter substrate-binding protein [Deltaproteobacteria bacterium]|nr:ABC transporter substrate-binding protein [Deltaproteobacteria bacterium]